MNSQNTTKYYQILSLLLNRIDFDGGLHLIGRSIPEVADEEHALAYRNAALIYEEYLKSGNYTVVFEGLLTYDDRESSQGSVREFADLAQRYINGQEKRAT